FSIFSSSDDDTVVAFLIVSNTDLNRSTTLPIPYEITVGTDIGTLRTLFAILDIVFTNSLSELALSEESAKAPTKSPFHALDIILPAVPARPEPTSLTPLRTPNTPLTTNPSPLVS